jgi:hypothetical protein
MKLYHFHQGGIVEKVNRKPPKKSSVDTYTGSAAFATSMLGASAATK